MSCTVCKKGSCMCKNCKDCGSKMCSCGKGACGSCGCYGKCAEKK